MGAKSKAKSVSESPCCRGVDCKLGGQGGGNSRELTKRQLAYLVQKQKPGQHQSCSVAGESTASWEDRVAVVHGLAVLVAAARMNAEAACTSSCQLGLPLLEQAASLAAQPRESRLRDAVEISAV